MANDRSGNTLLVDTSADFTGSFRICGIRYIGNASGTAQIKKTDTNGGVLWAASGATDLYEDVKMVCTQGIRVEVTNSAKVYLLLE